MIEIYRSSRIETLAQLLAEHLHQQPPASVLSPHTLIVGHLGMKRWLTQQLATMRREGRSPIAANLDMLLPSEWLDGLAQRVLGKHSIAIAPYRRTALRWRIHELLPTLDHPEVNRYLEGDDVPRRRFQLADRLAGLFGQYLVYRREWLQAWENGDDGGAPHWQNALWRQLVSDIGLDHRGRRMDDLAAKLPGIGIDPEQPVVHVFGVSHLPPDALGALDALSTSRKVQIYFPDPCRELWEDLRTERAVYAASLKGEAFLEIGHPLLAALGRLGQHYSLQLNGLNAGWDLRDHYDEAAFGLLPAERTLLERVQHSIRTLQPDWVKRPEDASDDPRADSSLRVHLCHTRLRELEVLKDSLLEQLAQAEQPGATALHPRDIVVMAPNMALYAPLLPVVFGAAGDSRALLPYRLADVALARTHPLLTAVRELIDLPTQRITRSQVLSLLALPAVSRRFGMDEGQHAALERWLDRAHVAWGLDGAMKQDFGAAPIDDHSFAFGFDRMFAGFLLGAVADDVLLDEQILPASPVAGPDGACLAALWGLLEVLREWRAGVVQTRSLKGWSDQLQGWMGRLFQIDPRDDGERSALAAVMSLAASLEQQQRDANIDVDINWTVVREVLVQGLDAVPERQPFLAGGITFCGMVPQRAIPFQVIALLGLNDGDYPRTRTDSGLDLMQTHPRMGDRDNRADDRYLFLEALMSARRALHLSFIGEGVNDGKPRNPALPLAELLGFLDRQFDLNAGAKGYDPPWRVRHPMQPFDVRYFDPARSDPRLGSYSQAFARLQADATAQDWEFLAGTPLLIKAGSAVDGPIELAAMMGFFKDPAKWICKQALKLSRDALADEAPNDTEPLNDQPHHFDSVHADLVWEALRTGSDTLPSEPPPAFLRSGTYASGELGRRTWYAIVKKAQPYLDLARSQSLFAAGAPAPGAQAVDLHLGGTRLIGSIGNVYSIGEQRWLVSISTSKPTFKQVIPLFIEWACLNLAQPQAQCELLMVHKKDKKNVALGPPLPFCHDRERLLDGLTALISMYRDAQHSAGVYYARSSYALAETLHSKPGEIDRARNEASKMWNGSDHRESAPGERDYRPLYNRMIAGDESFIETGSAANQRFEALATTLLEIITGVPANPEETA